MGLIFVAWPRRQHGCGRWKAVLAVIPFAALLYNPVPPLHLHPIVPRPTKTHNYIPIPHPHRHAVSSSGSVENCDVVVYALEYHGSLCYIFDSELTLSPNHGADHYAVSSLMVHPPGRSLVSLISFFCCFVCIHRFCPRLLYRIVTENRTRGVDYLVLQRMFTSWPHAPLQKAGHMMFR